MHHDLRSKNLLIFFTYSSKLPDFTSVGMGIRPVKRRVRNIFIYLLRFSLISLNYTLRNLNQSVKLIENSNITLFYVCRKRHARNIFLIFPSLKETFVLARHPIFNNLEVVYKCISMMNTSITNIYIVLYIGMTISSRQKTPS